MIVRFTQKLHAWKLDAFNGFVRSCKDSYRKTSIYACADARDREQVVANSFVPFLATFNDNYNYDSTNATGNATKSSFKSSLCILSITTF